MAEEGGKEGRRKERWKRKREGSDEQSLSAHGDTPFRNRYSHLLTEGLRRVNFLEAALVSKPEKTFRWGEPGVPT